MLTQIHTNHNTKSKWGTITSTSISFNSFPVYQNNTFLISLAAWYGGFYPCTHGGKGQVAPCLPLCLKSLNLPSLFLATVEAGSFKTQQQVSTLWPVQSLSVPLKILGFRGYLIVSLPIVDHSLLGHPTFYGFSNLLKPGFKMSPQNSAYMAYTLNIFILFYRKGY